MASIETKGAQEQLFTFENMHMMVFYFKITDFNYNIIHIMILGFIMILNHIERFQQILIFVNQYNPMSQRTSGHFLAFWSTKLHL